MTTLVRSLDPPANGPTVFDLPVCAYCDENLDPALGPAFEAGVGPVCWEQSRLPLSTAEEAEVRGIALRLKNIRRTQAETEVFLYDGFRPGSGLSGG